jgi:hypothetical protein
MYYVCMNECMYVWMNECMYLYVCMYVYVLGMYVCIYVCMYYLYTYECMYVCMCIYICLCVCMYVCQRVCVYVCIHPIRPPITVSELIDFRDISGEYRPCERVVHLYSWILILYHRHKECDGLARRSWQFSWKYMNYMTVDHKARLSLKQLTDSDYITEIH